MLRTTSSPASRSETAVAGGYSTVHFIAKWTALIGAVALSLCLVAVIASMCIVVVRDGNSPLVSDALHVIANVVPGMAAAMTAMALGPQAVSAIITRFMAYFPVPVYPYPSQPVPPSSPSAPPQEVSS